MTDTKLVVWVTKLRKIEKECSNYVTASDLAKGLKLDVVLIKQLFNANILQDTGKQIKWNAQVPVTTTLARTMYTRCRQYYASTDNRKSRKSNLSWWQSIKVFFGFKKKRKKNATRK